MTFVIKENFDEQYLRDDFLFDIEGYNFIYNRETLFTSDEKLIQYNYDKLSYIFKHYAELDPILFESLHYPCLRY